MSARPRRMPNFTSAEENVLRMLAEKYKNEIEKKGANADIWRSKKTAWANIEKEFFK